MKLIIDIPEEMYNNYKEYVILNNDAGYPSLGHLYEIIGKGVPLPKGHGRLIDADSVYQIVKPLVESDREWVVTAETAKRLIFDVFTNAPTIIEADKEGE